MKKFKNMRELLSSLLTQPYPAELMKDLLFSMFLIENGFCSQYGANQEMAYVVIAENQHDVELADTEFHIKGNIPELTETIETNQSFWEKQTYIFGNGGDGIVLYKYLGKKTQNFTE